MENKQRWKGQVVQHESWIDLLEALRTTYTLSFKDVCRIFRASRSWTNQYIKPFVPSVFLSSNNRGDSLAPGVNWIRYAAMKLDRPDMTESVWFHAEDLKAYVKSAIRSCTKQTKQVPITHLMPPDLVPGFVEKRKSLRQQIREAKDFEAYERLLEEYQDLPYQYFRKDEATQELIKNTHRTTARSAAPAVPVPLPDYYMQVWKAPHDLKDYGDADETIYRELFRTGAIRIELAFQDDSGKVGKKVFYIPDPDPIPDKYNEDYFIVSEAAWQQYQQQHRH